MQFFKTPCTSDLPVRPHDVGDEWSKPLPIRRFSLVVFADRQCKFVRAA
jgi:hypothetical protein